MFGAATPYVVAIASLLLCGTCALTLFKIVDHFDPPIDESVPMMDDAKIRTSARAEAGV